ncbi:TetR/AcrR family transcriptional regulator [Cryobacterium frigoriphilum]|uniref:TetR/AcrR family transcriptional regulator n=1 Tax=Cryobacterium frigoriphilum TaxID=1259150 RepID=A0A4R8ZU99_9MICO|nr:TetR/AcrR family transcriptional regulator [Cryobacterium frigoriphilum]TFD45983.1 TetR/AcrR family transcriptional regulator [Cryobacterium frigoriphilum]
MTQPLAAASRISQRRQAALSDGGADYSAKRAELIRIAAIVFREKGYATATLNDIAAVFGTDRASLYYYVASKEELFQECIQNILDTNVAAAAGIAELPVSPREKLTQLISLMIASQVEHYPYMYVYIQEDMRQVVSQDAEWATRMVEQTHRLEKFFRDAILEGVADGSFRDGLSATLVANGLFGMLLWTHRWYVPGTKYSEQELTATFTALFFDGLATP